MNRLKVMVVAPGALYSTYDTYNYYMDAFSESKNCFTTGFPFHNILMYHMTAREYIERTFGAKIGDSQHDIGRSARELLLEIWVNRPDVILFIDGTKYPIRVLQEIYAFRSETKRRFVVCAYNTEAPYLDEVFDEYYPYYDVIFSNDKYDVDRRNPTGDFFIHYLPHAYNKNVHYADPAAKQERDVFFCGTVFPERGRIMSGVDWTGINAKIAGAWSLCDTEDKDKIASFGIVEEGEISNDRVADFYRTSKICLNFNRTFGYKPNKEIFDIDEDSAYSFGPRVIEAVACGGFVISEPRQEIIDVFGDSVPMFRNSEELERLIKYFLENEQERTDLSRRARSLIENRTYSKNAEFILDIARQSLDEIVAQRS